MQTKLKKYKKTREDKAKFNLPFMTRLDSNVYKTFVMFFKSFQFSSELCFLGESSFEGQGRIKIFIFFISLMKFTITENYFMKPLNNFFMKQYFYEAIFYTVSKKNFTNHLLQVLLLYLSHHNIEIASWSQ